MYLGKDEAFQNILKELNYHLDRANSRYEDDNYFGNINALSTALIKLLTHLDEKESLKHMPKIEIKDEPEFNVIGSGKVYIKTSENGGYL